jgi:hypothetical protein
MSAATRQSEALGMLYEALRKRSLVINKAERQECNAFVHQACLHCYESGIGRARVHATIRAVVSEFETQ